VTFKNTFKPENLLDCPDQGFVALAWPCTPFLCSDAMGWCNALSS